MQKTLSQRINANTPASFVPRLEKILVLIFILQCGFHTHAQQYSFKNYTVASGLASSSVNHIFQDSKGYIWFATQGGGVSRFNGTDFKNFSKAEGLINNDVTYITEDNAGHIWMATAGGASEFNGISFQNYKRQEGLTDGVVYAIYADAKNKLWFATQNEGIRIYDRASFDSLTTKDGLASNEVYSIVQDRSGNYWFGLSNGIAKYNQGEITGYYDSEFIKDKAFFSAFLDDSNHVWFGSTSGTVVRMSGDNRIKNLELPSPFQNDFIGGIAQDKSGNMWLATDHGLLKYNGNIFKLFSEHEGLSVNTAQTVMCDYEGNIWAGTLGGGVNLLSSEAFMHFTEKDGLTGRNVTCVNTDNAGNLNCIGTSAGLYVFTPESKMPIRKASGIAAIEKINIPSLSEDQQGHLWVCAQEGVFVLEKKNDGFTLLKKYDNINGERLVSPTKIIHDSKGNCWIATYGSGLFNITKQNEKFYNTSTGFPSDKILTIYEDAHANIWFGTQDAGIIKYDGATFHPVSLNSGLADKSVWSIAEDNNGSIYWGTGESGLCRYDGENITTYTASDGLSSNYITALAWDQSENCLWIGSEKGLDKLKFTADYRIESLHAYTEQDGFSPVGINQDAIWIDKQGLIWLGTINGLWLFNRNDDFQKNTPPKIQLTGMRLFYQTVDWKKLADSIDSRTLLPIDLKLPYNKNHLTFDIQALTTQNPHYIFQLEGLDDGWSSPTKNNEITYSNISPGQQYTFKAKAINSGGNTSETISFSFAIKPPWWTTWWFLSALFLIIIASLIAFIKTREKVLREQNLKLEETVEQRTSEIAHQKEIVEKTLSEKEGLLHEKEILLKEIHHRVKNNLQTISSMLMLQSAGLEDEQAKKAITESQNRVRSIALVHQKLYQTDGLEKVELNSFVKDLTEQVKSLYHQQSKQVTIRWNIPETFILIDAAIPLGLILNELLTNSFKYAFEGNKAGEIKIELNYLKSDTVLTNAKRLNTKKVELTYRDNGPGFDSSVATGDVSTLGLRLVNLLSQQIGAALDYSNSNGSKFIFTFELNI